jgi:hypothetical protein
MRVTVAASLNSGKPSLVRRVSLIGRWIADCIEVMSEYYAAAAKYELLSRLSNAELNRRGLSRATLAREVLAAIVGNRPRN